MMRFQYSGGNEKLAAAVAFTNQLLEDPTFWDAVKADGPFTNTEISAADIAAFMQACPSHVDVLHFRPRFIRYLKYRKTVALVDPNRPFKILYHTRFFWRSVAQMVNTLVHEYVHVVDFFADENGRIEYSHNGQSSAGNARSAPYAIGTLAQDFYDAAQGPDAMMAESASDGAPLSTDMCGVDIQDHSVRDDELV